MFEALAEGKEVKVPLTQFDRMLRLGAGALFIMVGISPSNWLGAGIGGIIALMGIYDRCPIWRALTGVFKRNEMPLVNETGSGSARSRFVCYNRKI